MIAINKRPNGKYRIQDGVFIIKDNVDPAEIFNEMEKAIRDQTGAKGAVEFYDIHGTALVKISREERTR